MGRAMDKKSTKKNKGRTLIICGLLLITAALLLTGYNIWDEHRAADSAGDIMEQLDSLLPSPADPSDTAAVPDYILNPNMDMPVTTIDGQDYIGVLTIPALNLSLPIMSEWSYPKLKLAPNRYLGSAYTGDLIIAGHNYRTHFGGLSTLSAGDEVIFTDVDGNEFTYAVVELEDLMSTDVERMQAGDWDLTLFTCTLGGRSRVTVRCVQSGI